MSELLQRRYASQLDQDANELIGHIVASAGRMTSLIGEDAPLARVASKAAAQWAVNNLRTYGNGVGIAPAYHRRIFALWQRLHGAQYRGIGIGLTLCKSIVEKHGGSIWVESEPGQGAALKVTLPAEES